MTERTVLILGATSGIARSLVHEFARRNYKLILAGRDTEELQTIATDLQIRHGIQTTLQNFDAVNFRTHGAFWKRCLADCDNDLYGVVVCFGTMFDQAEAEIDWAKSKAMIDGNYTAAVSILNIAAGYFEEQKRGFIAVLSSVAGDRGRQSNYIYGSSKSAVSTYVQGLRQRLYKSGVSVTTVKPGPVDTGLTWGSDKLPLLAPPEKVASDTFRAIRRGADVVYTPGPWRIIMGILCAVPEVVWKRAKI
jgi:decaprenylphospho-beta-D-erythro-pentofuranosid-2-ulose 2-reductase